MKSKDFYAAPEVEQLPVMTEECFLSVPKTGGEDVEIVEGEW